VRISPFCPPESEICFLVQISNPEGFLFYIARPYLNENIQKCAYLAKFQSAK